MKMKYDVEREWSGFAGSRFKFEIEFGTILEREAPRFRDRECNLERPNDLEKGSWRERRPTECLPECCRTTLKAVWELSNPSKRFRFTAATVPAECRRSIAGVSPECGLFGGPKRGVFRVVSPTHTFIFVCVPTAAPRAE
ncbi:uncharacterized protein HKW66_Vig0238610 [Vigna angularis]|uniref:Uncharacterized protein n=1 Tax=Phaseolus angularis TaxID=3914 RepID=A0A8T0KSI4_PHAAN|nr:uncharacterized protein HKW66_Vig0238610 [Vigna angularis]